jgi:hypothetical protein
MVSQNEKRKLKVTHNAGFFSCSTIRLMDIINFHNKNNELPIVDSSEQWDSYKDDHTKDITNEFFEEKIVPEWVEPSHMTSSPHENQFSDYSLINFKYVNELIDIYFSPSTEIKLLSSNLVEKYGIDLNNTITICYRGNDKFRETNLPSYDEMIDKINLVISENPNHKILLQTDEIEFQELVQNKFKNVFTINENKKINRSNTAIQYTVPLGERVTNAKLFLATMLIMSKSSKIILNSGNVGMWICLFRGNNEDVYQYLNPKDRKIFNKWLK